MPAALWEAGPLWYANAMANFPGARILRWRLRGLLKLLPAREGKGARKPLRIAYLFTGTYGDFAQALGPLNRLAEAFPGCDLSLIGAGRYAREFATELPPNLRVVDSWEPWTWLVKRRDLLFTNAVGVYRVRFEFAARFCARRAYGFRHAHESRRGGYDATVALLPSIHSFAEENLKVLGLAGVDIGSPEAASTATDARPSDEAWGRGQILFHIGSAGLKRDFGLKVYTRLVLGILGKLDGRPVEVVMGPGDDDVALEIRSGTGLVPQMYPLSRLIRNLRNFEGTVLCFNSFLAHLCLYLGRPAVVIHRQAVPFGYDCGPLHRQVILKAEKGWDLAEVWDALELRRP